LAQVLGYGLDDWGIESLQGLGNFLFTTQPSIKWVLEAFSLGVKRPGSEADHSLPSSAKIKKACSYTSIPNTPSWHGTQLKHRDNFTFTTLLRLR
jgi:hypothetical protein